MSVMIIFKIQLISCGTFCYYTDFFTENLDVKYFLIIFMHLQIILDGPYGAPSSHIFRAQHAVLIATGIGVTPFASILQSIMFKYWKARHTCPNCMHSFSSDIPRTVMNLKKVIIKLKFHVTYS